jgi:hypothetical protein
MSFLKWFEPESLRCLPEYFIALYTGQFEKAAKYLKKRYISQSLNLIMFQASHFWLETFYRRCLSGAELGCKVLLW